MRQNDTRTGDMDNSHKTSQKVDDVVISLKFKAAYFVLFFVSTYEVKENFINPLPKLYGLP